MLKHMKINLKLLLLVTVPIIGLLAFGSLAVVDRLQTLRNIRETQVLVGFSIRSGALIHELQKERGLSAGFLSTRGGKFGDALRGQRRESDRCQEELERFLGGRWDELAPVRPELQRLRNALAGLHDLRTKVDGQSLQATDAIAAYTVLIRANLDAIAVIPRVSRSKEISMAAVGYDAFLSAKEMTGRERAVMNAGFSADRFEPALYLKIPALLADQRAYLGLFKNYADPVAVRAFEDRSSATAFTAVEGYQKIALAKGLTGGMGVQPEQWFATITAKINLMKEVEDLLAKRLDTLSARQAQRAFAAMLISLVLTLVLSVLSVWLGMVLIRGITQPLHQQIDMLKDIAEGEGDLRRTLPEDRRDELGEVAHWFNRFIANIQTIIVQVAGTTTQVSTASTQLEGTAEQIATAAEEVAAQSLTVATAGEEMSATSHDISRNCNAAAGVANSASRMAAEGAEVVQETLRGMDQIAQRVREAARTVESLGARSDQIGVIVSTIEDIADQTNLLALNAAIEAARAGEMGRGFAVVADEVRALAERTARATREISGMIKGIQTDTEGAVTSMNSGVQVVESGMDSSRRSGQALQQIMEAIAEVTMQMNQIATAAEEQTATTSEISANIHQISVVVQQTAQGAHETAGAAATLSQSARGLERLVGRFSW